LITTGDMSPAVTYIGSDGSGALKKLKVAPARTEIKT
jgi:hypothetical protein